MSNDREVLPSIELDDPRALRAYAHPLRLTLVGLLRTEGSLTATRAAELTGESVASCSFHLRQLAKYGLVEHAPGGQGREKPWRATAMATSWSEPGDADPELVAATNMLDAAILDRYTERVRAWHRRRAGLPRAWRRAADSSDALVYLTPAELTDLTERTEALLSEYYPRNADPSRRPDDALPVAIIRLAFPEPFRSSRPRAETDGQP
ncbi:MAG TPA: helix-turn-helix domain-containing protein [Cryptosporangiaceae bacterium]|nr:helix-turn-helix domain-containing protein [Cryptosporangiaceae bacterium]